MTNKHLALVLIIALTFVQCSIKVTDPVIQSEYYQPWDKTQQPQGSAAYLGLGSYAKVLCSAIFVSGRQPEEAALNSGRIILDSAYHEVVQYQIDSEKKRIYAMLGDSLRRSASYTGDQGCIIDTEEGLRFTPTTVSSNLPPPEEQDWPMGDRLGVVDDPEGSPVLKKVIEAAFHPQAMTAAFLVIHHGKIITEVYADGIDRNTQLESWSMGKSLTATLIGRLIQMGKLGLGDQAPIKEWQQPGDPRSEITVRNLMQMSSGLRFPAHRDPTVEVPLAQLAHMYVYTDAIDVFDFAINRPLEFIPGTTGRYRNCDPLILGSIIRQIVEKDGRNYLTWPQEELFDKIGIRRQVMETDPYGNFILTGFDYGTARNWARLGLLYLQDGIWKGERLLPEGFVDFISTPAKSWDQPIYGGLFWINGTNELALPADTYYMAGGGGQRTIICPALDLVVVRMGHSKGGDFVDESLNEALGLIVKAIENN